MSGFDEVKKLLGVPDSVVIEPNGTTVTSYTVDLKALGNELIKEDIEQGGRWSKCANCGDPYPLTEDWTSETVCSNECSSSYADYLMNPDQQW